MFNREVPLPESRVFRDRRNREEKPASPPDIEKIGGIRLPSEDDPGTGNIIIRGKPGTGKTTLALQIATSCYGQGTTCQYAIANNYFLATYISFEQPIEFVYTKACHFGWQQYLRPITHLHNLSSPPTPRELGETLALILLQDKLCPFREEINNLTASHSVEPLADNSPRDLDEKIRRDLNEKMRRTKGTIRRLLVDDLKAAIKLLDKIIFSTTEQNEKIIIKYNNLVDKSNKLSESLPSRSPIEEVQLTDIQESLNDVMIAIITFAKSMTVAHIKFTKTKDEGRDVEELRKNASDIMLRLCLTISQTMSLQQIISGSFSDTDTASLSSKLYTLTSELISLADGYAEKRKCLARKAACKAARKATGEKDKTADTAWKLTAVLRDVEGDIRAISMNDNLKTVNGQPKYSIADLLDLYNDCMQFIIRFLSETQNDYMRSILKAFNSICGIIQRTLALFSDLALLIQQNREQSGQQGILDEDDRLLQCVLLPALTPRSVTPQVAESDQLFWDRYHQLEALLVGAHYIRKQMQLMAKVLLTEEELKQQIAEQTSKLPVLLTDERHSADDINETPEISIELYNRLKGIPYDLRVICLDSLNVFSDRPLTREEIYRLFDLFRRYGVVGIFTLEEDEESTIVDPAVQASRETAEYLADLVVHLDIADDQGYLVRHFEVVKSRYHHQTYGKHPFRLEHSPLHRLPTRLTSVLPRDSGIIIYPSLHYLVSETNQSLRTDNPDEDWRYHRLYYRNSQDETMTSRDEQKKENDDDPSTRRNFSTGIKGLDYILPQNVRKESIIALKGPRDTFKTTAALNFLFDGLRRGEDVLLLHLSESCRELRQTTVSLDMLPIDNNLWGFTEDNNPAFHPDNLDFVHAKRRQTTKYETWTWRYSGAGGMVGTLTEFAFKSGMIVPEQLMEMVRQTFYEKKITRVVLDDVSLIGLSYPLLGSSLTSGDIFLSILIHFLRNHQVGATIVGTTGLVEKENDIVDKACLLASAVVNFDFRDIFGDRYVIVTGEGLISSSSRGAGHRIELVPGVTRLKYDNLPTDIKRALYIDCEYLEGLVGFDTSHIHRPGVLMHMFAETGIQQKYNDSIRTMLSFAFGETPGVPKKSSQSKTVDEQSKTSKREEILVRNFDSMDSGPFHQSLGLLQGKPLDSTVIATIDEFWLEFFQQQSTSPKLFDLPLVALNEVKGLKELLKELNAKNNYAIPYYRNILVIACAKNDVSIPEGDNFTWESFATEFENNTFQLEIDHTARETLSCLLLDALISGYKRDKNNNSITATKNAESSEIDHQLTTSLESIPEDKFDADIHKSNLVVREVSSLIKLLRPCCLRYKKNEQSNSESPDDTTSMLRFSLPVRDTEESIELQHGHVKKSPEPRLKTDADVYICWYTQLRELVQVAGDSKDKSHLANKLLIYKLPGGGFTGDWHLGILNGSVSINLGSQIIKTLTNVTEEYNRLVQGVGLPVRDSFYKAEEACNFTAWAQSQELIQKVQDFRSTANRWDARLA